MRPMTASEALGHTRDLYRRLSSMDTREAVKLEHADALLDALVELREAQCALDYHLRYSPLVPLKPIKWRRRKKVLEREIYAAERKLAALERGEEPEES